MASKRANGKLYKKILELCSDSKEIVLFDGDEAMDWGLPEVSPDGIRITSRLANTKEGVKTWFYPWNDISLMYREGFRAKQIKDDLRKFEKSKVYVVALGETGLDRYMSPMLFGDPFEIFADFSIVGGGIFAEQSGEAQAIIMPQTEVIRL